MAKIVVETTETKKKVMEALQENDFRSAVEFYKENSVSGQLFGTILNGGSKNDEHRLLLQINPSNDDKASGSFVIGFTELAEAVYDALSYGGQVRALSDYPAFGESQEDVSAGFSEPKSEFGACDPAAIMEKKRAQAKSLTDALGGAVDRLLADMPRYDAWLSRVKRPEGR